MGEYLAVKHSCTSTGSGVAESRGIASVCSIGFSVSLVSSSVLSVVGSTCDDGGGGISTEGSGVVLNVGRSGSNLCELQTLTSPTH